MMNTDPAERQLIDAETKLARALQRLSALRRAALYGSYDATEFDQAVMAYRAAEADVLDARKTWAQRKESPVATLVPDENEEIVPLEPTPRLLFAKWLVQSGKLSDWDVETTELSDSPERELLRAA
jgi:multidrug efflux pump subunit AcrA (membrane-fusion protein)